MHPAPSLILFTTLSGLGLGGLAWALLALAQGPDHGTIMGVAATWGLSAVGLMLSSAHLKNPKNAWRAFTQPGSSWLSREAWLAVLTMVAAPDALELDTSRLTIEDAVAQAIAAVAARLKDI